MSKYILGISCFYHDSAACLLREGEVVVAVEEERFSRKKHDSSFPINAVKFCLDFENISSKDLDYVVFNEKPFSKFERIIKTIFATYPFSFWVFREAINYLVRDKLWIKNIIEEKTGVGQDKILFSEHHLSHAAGSFFCSPFSEAAILNCDGVGEWATTTLGRARADWTGSNVNEIELFEEIRFPHSLGLFYSAFTAFLGFEVNEGEYKVMGMAAFGEPKYTDKIFKIIKVNCDGSFALDMEYFAFHYSAKKTFSRKFEDLFGKPRDCKARFVTQKTSLYDDKNFVTEEEIEKNQYYADIAASIQKVTEEVLLKISSYLYKKTGLKKLCLSGGVALNCLVNTRVLEETPFEEIFIQPAAGDSGAAIGAALYAYHCFLGGKRKFVLKDVYLGKEYSDRDIEHFLSTNKIEYSYIKDESELIDAVVDCILAQEVIGWFQGRFEWGPRALGNRSILADPRGAAMKDIVNIKIKFREPFRPFAPSVLLDKVSDLFELGKFDGQYPLRFMLYTLPVKRADLIPGATHVDGSCRLQVVDKEVNPLYYRLINRFYQLTGIPALLNTSFNLKGEPIVNTPENAYNTFMNSGMDVLVLGHFIVRKKDGN